MFKFLNRKVGWLASLGLLASSQVFAYGTGVAVIVFDPNSNLWGSYHGADSGTGNTAQDRIANETAALSKAGIFDVSVYDIEANQSYVKETWVHDGWIAYAHGWNNSHFGTSGLHDSQYSAESAALARCNASTGDNQCYIVRSLSAYTYQDDVSGTDTSQR